VAVAVAVAVAVTGVARHNTRTYVLTAAAVVAEIKSEVSINGADVASFTEHLGHLGTQAAHQGAVVDSSWTPSCHFC
jgi:hypothetical protein